MSNQAQFTAMVKKMATDDKKMVLSLELVGNIEPTSLVKLVDMIGDKVTVNLGNPQMAMEFDENEREERRGLSVTTDPSGVVTQVSGDTGDEYDTDYEDTDDLEKDGDESEGPEHNEQAGEEGDKSPEDGEGSENTPIVQPEEFEEEQQSNDESKDNENDGDQGPDNQEDAAATIDKEALEAFILSGQAPVFDEFTFDFPELLQRKKSGETWVIIAKSLGVSSTKVASELREYKKLVAEHMAKQNGEEPGAA
ncbi:hypothetical protein [Brevibacillus porteri]|uniref:Uncharacterized protein n=1 Tax=Brevibacillus porteri TaxID=2126350 RepID=A0ABX5FQF7_9BACL|nr:hypothetical protein [Brevibacillus porteri]MED1800658.1 hypothetical protein [Brevibacillus porteri]MED2134714.1 hypothetical protein [Brevibacillus porteri]MED2745629.1 hypothetical protein [Brevibacillus porteri]MED2814733.1 hypothetical protein [Brevibacillus porteri]MED2898056.1 hypothetical protein [Brevibacillus porteri]